MTLEVTVVIPSYGRSARLPPLLRALARQTLSPDRFEVVVADDCSPDDTAEVVAGLAGELPYVLHYARTPVNHGPAAARNLGWRSASAPFVAFIDDDCDPAPEWLQAGLAAFEGRPNVGIVQGRTHAPEGESTSNLGDWYIWRVIEEPSAFFEGCNLFFRRDVLEITGGFDEEIAYHGEDSAAGWRVIEAGFDRAFAPEASMAHPIELRGLGWHVDMGRLESRIVWCAAKHPGFRQQGFWRPWAYRREDPALVAALVGVALGTRFRPALLLALPYLWWQRPSLRHRSFFRLCLQVPYVDTVRLTAHLRASLRHRILVM